MMSNPQTVVVKVGIDIGCESCKVVLGASHSCEIVRSDSGNHVIPTVVSFHQKLRLVGDAAANNARGNKNAIIHLNRLLSSQLKDENDLLEDFYLFQYDKKEITGSKDDDDNNNNNDEGAAVEITVTVDYNNQSQSFTASAVLATFLNKIKNSIASTIHRLQSQQSSNGNNNISNSDFDIQYVFAVNPTSSTTRFTQQQIYDSAYAAGILSDNKDKSVSITTTSYAYAMAYRRKFPPPKQGDEAKRKVLVIDMGHAQTLVTIFQYGGETTAENTEEKETEEGKDETSNNRQPVEILVSKCNTCLGAGCVDVRLWHHFQSTMAALSDVKPKSRAGQRLLDGCRKLKHLLSQLPDGSVTVENINDADISLKMSRAALAELCAPDATTLKELIQSAITEAAANSADDGEELTNVEILGGGCRIPWVQDTIQQALPESISANMILSRSLDDTSAALGAAIIGEERNSEDFIMPSPIPDEECWNRRKQLREAELTMEALDAEQKEIAHIRNQLESRVLELRSAKNSNKHGNLLPDNVNEYLDQIDDWLFSEEANEAATLDAMQLKEKETMSKIEEMCAEYYAAVEKDEKEKEKEMEEAAKKAQAEKGDDEENGDNDDHDNRRLPKKRRMEIVMKNKEEANELFKDGNYKFAAARYTKALSHCAKFVDLNPDDQEEVKGMKVTLNLNLALAYSKLENYDQALRVCNDAIALDGESNAKALYRRASIYHEKKMYPEAKQDVKKAMEINKDDKALKKLLDRIELQIKKQKEKEKKMAAKMFG